MNDAPGRILSIEDIWLAPDAEGRLRAQVNRVCRIDTGLRPRPMKAPAAGMEKQPR